VESRLSKIEKIRQIPVGWLEIGEKEKNVINEILESGRISEGKKTYEFEKKWSEFIGAKYCVATSSGTAALITGLTALKYHYKLENRPKVITSPLTYISDANAIVLSGFEPIFVDIDPNTFNITPEGIEKCLKNSNDISKFSIVLPVDLMGYPVKLDQVKQIAQKYNLHVLDDAAEAHGTTYKGKKCGSDADIGVFSFYIAHNIQAGEMGAVTTNNYDLYLLSKKIKTNGRFCECETCTRDKGFCPSLNSYKGEDDFDPRFFHDIIGYNFKTMEFQAAIGIVQLEKIEEIISKRLEIVKYLNEHLEEFSHFLQLPLFQEEVSYLAYPIVIKKPEFISRRKLRTELEIRGIETRPLFGCIPTQQPAYSYLKEKYSGKLPNAEYIGANGFYIGCHQYLTKEDLDYIINSFKDILK